MRKSVFGIILLACVLLFCEMGESYSQPGYTQPRTRIAGDPGSPNPLLEQIRITQDDLPPGFIWEIGRNAFFEKTGVYVCYDTWLNEGEERKIGISLRYSLYPSKERAREAIYSLVNGLSIIPPKIDDPLIGDDVWSTASPQRLLIYARRGRLCFTIRMGSLLYNRDKKRWEMDPHANLPVKQVINTLISRIKAAGLDK